MQDTISKLKSIFKQKNYVWNEYINIGNVLTNKFDDKLIVAYFRNNKWEIVEYNVTLDPGKYYTSIKLLNPKGVAIKDLVTLIKDRLLPRLIKIDFKKLEKYSGVKIFESLNI